MIKYGEEYDICGACALLDELGGCVAQLVARLDRVTRDERIAERPSLCDLLPVFESRTLVQPSSALGRGGDRWRREETEAPVSVCADQERIPSKIGGRDTEGRFDTLFQQFAGDPLAG